MHTILSYNASHRAHVRPGHVERPERLDTVMTALEKHPTWRRVRRIDAEPASEDDLLLVHGPDYVRRVRDACDRGPMQLDADTYVTPSSYAVALEAVGCALAVTRNVVDGRSRNGFAAIRPPGHHASPSRAMGFCLFSNAAIAARWAQQHAGIDRVLIIDFDVHHGNGTQDAFYEDGTVLYVSLHQAPFYPGSGAAHERGHGAGIGTTLNMPFPSGTGDAAYRRVTKSILGPHAVSFDPDLIVLSAGYDAHWRDPLGGMRLSVNGFADVIREILILADTCCDGRLVGILEGGYDTQALAACVAATAEILYDPEADIHDPIGAPPGRDLDVDDYLDDLEAFHAEAGHAQEGFHDDW